MKTAFVAVCLLLYVVQSSSYVILDSCPPGCECFHRNSVVECREAHLKEIPVLKFANIVKRLVLRGNEIKKIEPHRLRSYRNLEYLDVSDNEISMLPGKVFHHNYLLREINLGLNPFECDCELRGFIEMLQTYHEHGGLTLKNPDLTNCAGPQAFMARPLLGITFQDQKNALDETMYIGEEDNRGIAFCAVKRRAPPRHAMLKAKPTPAATRTPPIQSRQDSSTKKKSPNYALIAASVTAAVLVTCITSVRAVRYLRKNNRWRNYRDNFLAYFKKKPAAQKEEPATFSEHIKKQRRASCGYAESDCSSDEEINTSPPKKRGKDGYIAVPTAEPRDLKDVPLGDSG